MRFGIFDIMQIPPDVPSPDAFLEHLSSAVLADELGLDDYFIAEHHFLPFYRPPSPSRVVRRGA